jgi:hypothetical protein
MKLVSKFSPLHVQAELPDGTIGVVKDAREWQREDGTKYLRLAVNVLDENGAITVVASTSDEATLSWPILSYIDNPFIADLAARVANSIEASKEL